MQKNPSFAGLFLKTYREGKKLTQEQFSNDIAIEPRTLRAYETGERQLTNVNELRRIADLLGVEAEKLGVTTAVEARTSEDIETTIQAAWHLIDETRVLQARTLIENLAQHLRTQITSEDPTLLRSLAQTCHTSGYITSELTHAKQSYEAIVSYKEMETISRIIGDDTMLNISLTYQGDMYRRLGDLDKAILYLEAARDTTPDADAAAKGNGIQLLARVYFSRKQENDFDRAMHQAEEYSFSFNPGTSNSTRGHYNAGTVYEDWARATAEQDTHVAMKYLDKSEAYLPQTKFWELLLQTSKAIVLAKGGYTQEAVSLAIKVHDESREAGILRYVDRVRSIDKYLEQKEHAIRKARTPLQDILYGDGAF